MLEENGVEVLITKVPATSGVEARARVLEAKIAEVYPGREVHLIGKNNQFHPKLLVYFNSRA